MRTATNKMITLVAEKFGVSSNEAVLMRLLVRPYLTRRGTSYEDCKSTYETLMKKKVVKK